MYAFYVTNLVKVMNCVERNFIKSMKPNPQLHKQSFPSSYSSNFSEILAY